MTKEDAAGRIASVGERAAALPSDPVVASTFSPSCERTVVPGRTFAGKDLSDLPTRPRTISERGGNIDFGMGDVASTGIVIDRCWLDAENRSIAASSPPIPCQLATQLEFTSYDILLRVRGRIDLTDAADLPESAIPSDSMIEPVSVEQCSAGDPLIETSDSGGVEEGADESTELSLECTVSLDCAVSLDWQGDAAHGYEYHVLGSGDCDDRLPLSGVCLAGESQSAPLRLSSLHVVRVRSLIGCIDLFGDRSTTILATPTASHRYEIAIIDCWFEREVNDVEIAVPTPITNEPVTFVGALGEAGEAEWFSSRTIGGWNHDWQTLANVTSQTICESVYRSEDGFEFELAACIDQVDDLAGKIVDWQLARFTPIVFEIIPGLLLEQEQAAALHPIAWAVGIASALETTPADGNRPIAGRELGRLKWQRARSNTGSAEHDFLLRPDRPDRLRSAWVRKSSIPHLRRRKRRNSKRRR